MPEEVESELKHAWDILKSILIIPFLPILIPLGKKNFSDFFGPIKELWEFFWDAKFTALMIILNIAIYIGVIIYLIFGPGNTSFEDDPYLRILLNSPSDMLNPTSPVFLSILFSGFWHFGFAHLFGNMLFLFAFGRLVEKKLGIPKTAFLYFFAIIASSVTSSLYHLNFGNASGFGAGASGGISGLGAAAMLLAPLGITFVYVFPLPIILLTMVQFFSDALGAAETVAGVESSTGFFAHLGGFIFVIPFMFFIYKEDRSKMILGSILAIIIAAIFIAVQFLVPGDSLGGKLGILTAMIVNLF